MFLFGLEIFIIVTVGALYVYCDNINHNKEETKCGAEPAKTKSIWLNKISHFIAKMKGDFCSRIHSDACCICCEEIKTEVQSSCGHIFCGR